MNEEEELCVGGPEVPAWLALSAGASSVVVTFRTPRKYIESSDARLNLDGSKLVVGYC